MPLILKLCGGTHEAIFGARFRVQKNDTQGDEKGAFGASLGGQIDTYLSGF